MILFNMVLSLVERFILTFQENSKRCLPSISKHEWSDAMNQLSCNGEVVNVQEG